MKRFLFFYSISLLIPACHATAQLVGLDPNPDLHFTEPNDAHRPPESLFISKDSSIDDWFSRSKDLINRASSQEYLDSFAADLWTEFNKDPNPFANPDYAIVVISVVILAGLIVESMVHTKQVVSHRRR